MSVKMDLRHDTRRNGIVAALFYAVCSTSMAFLNKAVLSSYDFNFPFFIMTCQMTMSVLFLELMTNLGIITIPSFTFKGAKQFLLPSLCYGLHATLSLIALRGMNIPMYTAVKRCTPLVNLVFSVVILHKPLPSLPMALSIITITAGCIVAVYGDLTFDLFTYAVGGLSVLAQGLYLSLVQSASERHLSTFEILQLNSYNTLGPFIFLSVFLGEPEEIVKSSYIYDFVFHLLFWSLVSLGAVLNFSLFLCTSINSALTTSLVGVGKSSVQTVVGFFVFGGIRFHPWNVVGILLNFMGGVVYTFIKYSETKKMSKGHIEDSHSRKSGNRSNDQSVKVV